MRWISIEQAWRQRSHPAGWPPPARAGLGLAVFFLPLLAGWHLYLAPAKRTLLHAAQEELQLKTAYADKLQQTTMQPALQAQQQWLRRRLAWHEQQFSDDDDLAILLGEIAASAAHHQLTLEQAIPAPAIKNTHYFALPLQLRLSGRYHDIGRFAATLAAAPRTLILEQLQVSGKENDGVLSLEMQLLCYRRLPTANPS